MDPAVIAQFLAGAQFVQSKILESIAIAGVDYSCSESSTESFDLTLEEGGAAAALKASVVILKLNLPIAPARRTATVFRSDPYRVTIVNDLVTSWEIHLVQQLS